MSIENMDWDHAAYLIRNMPLHEFVNSGATITHERIDTKRRTRQCFTVSMVEMPLLTKQAITLEERAVEKDQSAP